MPSAAFIRLDAVHKTYRLGETLVPALRGASLDLRRGEFTALVGPSGSGKSTLLNMIGCIDEPDQGAVLVEGRDVAHLSDDERSRLRNEKIGFIFQSFNLVPVLDVYENVELPLLINERIPAGERHDRVLQAITDVELEPVRPPRTRQALGRATPARRDCARARHVSPAGARRRADGEPRLGDGASPDRPDAGPQRAAARDVLLLDTRREADGARGARRCSSSTASSRATRRRRRHEPRLAIRLAQPARNRRRNLATALAIRWATRGWC